VTSDLKTNSGESLEYLRTNAATRYTFEEYQAALAQEYLPSSLDEAKRDLIATSGRFSLQRIGDDVAEYLLSQKLATARPPVPVPINLD
jgi:hypothetical protein